MGGWHNTEVAFVLLTQPARVRFLAFSRFFENFLMLLRLYISALLREWTVQSLIFAQTHLVRVSGKLVLQKRTLYDFVRRKKRGKCWNP